MEAIIIEIAQKLGADTSKLKQVPISGTDLWMVPFRVQIPGGMTEDKEEMLGVQCLVLKDNDIPDTEDHFVVILYASTEKLCIKQMDNNNTTIISCILPIEKWPMCLFLATPKQVAVFYSETDRPNTVMLRFINGYIHSIPN